MTYTIIFWFLVLSGCAIAVWHCFCDGNDAYWDGFAVGIRDGHQAENPFVVDTEEWTEFNRGFIAGIHARERSEQ